MQVVPVRAAAPPSRPTPSSHVARRATLTQLYHHAEQVAPLYKQAACVLFHMLHNCAIAVAAAWVFTYLFSLGNIFSGSRPMDQSFSSFTAASTAWSSLVGAGTGVALGAASLMQFHFLSSPENPPTWITCIALLLRRTYRSCAVYSLLAVATSYWFGRRGPAVQQWKLHFYISWFILNLYSIHLIKESRQIFHHETVEGQAHGRRHGSSRLAGSSVPAWRRLASGFKKDLPKFLSVYSAAVYVHASSQFEFQNPLQLLGFSVASLVLKLAFQEIAARAVMKDANCKQHHIYLSITVPTVLIDTQIRILLLRGNATASESSDFNIQFVGTGLLAIAEVLTRGGKIWWLKRRIRRGPPIASGGITTTTGHSTTTTTGTTTTTDATTGSPAVDVERWKDHFLHFHAAEAQADMYAEYIAMGCSMCIYYFFHGHPKYRLTGTPGSVTSKETVILSWGYAQLVALQLLLELVIDFACSMIEIAAGVPCKVPDGSSVFVAALFTTCAMVNVALSSVMYLANNSEY